MTPESFYNVVIFLYGIVIGSFLNVCIYRIPLKENIARERSHCMSCGNQLRWFELIPLFSYLALRGRCRKCKARISIQYPVIEALNGSLYLVVFWVNGYTIDSILCCLLTSALIVLSVIDFRTYEIPFGINVFILALGLIRLLLNRNRWMDYVIGFFAVSILLFFIIVISKGNSMGGGDMKLMAAAGLFLGWKLILLSLVLGCVIGSIIHVIRMIVSKVGRELAFGPYLSIGIFLSMLWGEKMIQMYMSYLSGLLIN